MSRPDPEPGLRGTGVGLRGPHVPDILAQQPAVPWFELLTDNHLAAGGALRFQAEAVAEQYPVTLHGVGMSLGSVDPLDLDYVRRVRDLARRLDASHVSEHIAFAAADDVHSHDLLPLPWTEEALVHLANIAVKVGRGLRIDPGAEQIIGDEEANALMGRQYRDGHWAIPTNA